MRKTKIILLLIIVLLSLSSCKFTSNTSGNEFGSILGIVKNSNDNPIKNVEIKIENNIDLTNVEGAFIINNISTGEHTISLAKEGYQKKSFDLNVNEGENNLGSIILNKLDPNEKPEILSIELSSTEVSDGTEISGTIRVESNVPVDWLNSSFYGPKGNIYGGGSGKDFTEVEPDIWEYSWTDKVSQYAPSGKYYYENISVENEGELESDVWPNELSIMINNG